MGIVIAFNTIASLRLFSNDIQVCVWARISWQGATASIFLFSTPPRTARGAHNFLFNDQLRRLAKGYGTEQDV
jgi:hypothetical protein